jgi:hypothetical protein
MKSIFLFIFILGGLACLQGDSFASPMIEIPVGSFVSGDISGAGKNKAAVAVIQLERG